MMICAIELNKINLEQESTMSRFRIRDTWIPHSYPLKREDQLLYHGCHSSYIIKHVLIECSNFIHIRNTFYTINDIHILLREVDTSKVTECIKELEPQNVHDMIGVSFIQIYTIIRIGLSIIPF